MESPKKKRATYQDVLAAPEYKVAEIIGGDLRLSPRPGGPATAVASSLHSGLNVPFGFGQGGPGGWVILFEPELHIAGEVVVPDLAGWRLERMPVIPDAAFFTVTPDWVCEVLSKSNVRVDRFEKMPFYAAIGVRHAWLVHPRMRGVEALRLHEGGWLAIGVYKDDDRARIEPFEAIELDVSRLWTALPFPTRASEPTDEWDYERASPGY